MTRDEILETVKNAVAETMEVDASTLDANTTLESLQADSLDKIELVVALEEELSTSVDDDVLAQISTLGDCVDAIEKALG